MPMELEQIEALPDLSWPSPVDLFNLLGRTEQLHNRLTAEMKKRQKESTSKTRDSTDHGAVGVRSPDP